MSPLWIDAYNLYDCRRSLAVGSYTLEHINWWVAHHAVTPYRLALAA